MYKEEIKQAFCHINEEDLKIAYAGVKVDKSLTDAVKNRYTLAEKYFIQGAEWMREQCRENATTAYNRGYAQYPKDHTILREIVEGKAMVVDTEWLKNHDKQMIDKACEAYKNVLIRHFGIDKFNSRLHDMEVLIGKFRNELSN